jgi:hypothetical protein
MSISCNYFPIPTQNVTLEELDQQQAALYKWEYFQYGIVSFWITDDDFDPANKVTDIRYFEVDIDHLYMTMVTNTDLRSPGSWLVTRRGFPTGLVRQTRGTRTSCKPCTVAAPRSPWTRGRKCSLTYHQISQVSGRVSWSDFSSHQLIKMGTLLYLRGRQNSSQIYFL